MWPYYMLILYVFMIVVFCKPRIGDRRNWKYFILIVPLFLFAALRGNGRGDYFGYLNRGEDIKTLDDVLHKSYIGMEIGYRFIAYMVRKLDLPRQFVVISMNALSLSTITCTIKKYSKDWCISLLLFVALFIQFDMHAARTAVAIGFCAVGYDFIKKRNFIKYIFCVSIGAMFHTTALVAIPLYFLYNKNISIKNGLVVLFIELILIRFMSINILLRPIFNGLHLEMFARSVDAYTKSETYGYALKLYDPRIWIAIAVFFIAKTNIRDKDEDEMFMCNGVFLYSFVLILFSHSTFLAYRLSAYYYMYLVLLIPSIILKYHRDTRKYEYSLSKYERTQLFYLYCLFFTILNIAYVAKEVEYMTFFETGVGLLHYK